MRSIYCTVSAAHYGVMDKSPTAKEVLAECWAMRYRNNNNLAVAVVVVCSIWISAHIIGAVLGFVIRLLPPTLLYLTVTVS
jgi:hypothetical protein